MKASTKFTGLVGIAAAIVLSMTLTGCAPDAGIPNTPSTPSISDSPAATAAPEVVISELADGAVLTPEEAAAVEADKSLGLHAYELPDGTKVLTSYRSELPEAVKVDVAKKISAGTVSTTDGINGATEAVSAAGSSTGRSIIAVIPVKASCAMEDLTPRAAWLVVSANEYLSCNYVQSEAVAFAKAFRAKQSMPADWDVVVNG